MKFLYSQKQISRIFCWNIERNIDEGEATVDSNEYENKVEKTAQQIINIVEKYTERFFSHEKIQEIFINNIDSEYLFEETQKEIRELFEQKFDIKDTKILDAINRDIKKCLELFIEAIICVKTYAKEETTDNPEGVLNQKISTFLNTKSKRRKNKHSSRLSKNIDLPGIIKIPNKIQGYLESNGGIWNNEFLTKFQETTTEEQEAFNKLMENFKQQWKTNETKAKSSLNKFFRNISPDELITTIRAFNSMGCPKGIVPSVVDYKNEERIEKLSRGIYPFIRIHIHNITVEQKPLPEINSTIIDVNQLLKTAEQKNYDFMDKRTIANLSNEVVQSLQKTYGDQLEKVKKIKINVSRNTLRYVRNLAQKELSEFAKNLDITLSNPPNYQELASKFWTHHLSSAIEKQFPQLQEKIEINTTQLGAIGAPSIYAVTPSYKKIHTEQMIIFKDCKSPYPEDVQKILKPWLEENDIIISGEITQKKLLNNKKFTNEMKERLYQEILMPNEKLISKAYEQWNETNVEVISEKIISQPIKTVQKNCGRLLIFYPNPEKINTTSLNKGRTKKRKRKTSSSGSSRKTGSPQNFSCKKVSWK